MAGGMRTRAPKKITTAKISTNTTPFITKDGHNCRNQQLPSLVWNRGVKGQSPDLEKYGLETRVFMVGVYGANLPALLSQLSGMPCGHFSGY